MTPQSPHRGNGSVRRPNRLSAPYRGKGYAMPTRWNTFTEHDDTTVISALHHVQIAIATSLLRLVPAGSTPLLLESLFHPSELPQLEMVERDPQILARDVPAIAL